MGYQYLFSKLHDLWKPSAAMECIDLGFDYFLIRFLDKKDLDKVISGGPWFIGGQFVAIRK